MATIKDKFGVEFSDDNKTIVSELLNMPLLLMAEV